MKNLVQRVLGTSLLAVSLFLNGCMSDQDLKNLGKGMDNLSENVLSGGGLLWAAGRSEAQRGNFDKANAYQALGDIQNASSQRQNALDAAREGRSEVNIYNQNNNSAVQSFETFKVYPFRWIDLNGNKIVDIPDETIETYQFNSGETPMIAIVNSSKYNLKVRIRVESIYDSDVGVTTEDEVKRGIGNVKGSVVHTYSDVKDGEYKIKIDVNDQEFGSSRNFKVGN